MRLDVQRVLVLQAAQQPAARARDAQRVQRQVLVLRHPDRYGLEVLEERRTAQVMPARSDPALHAGLVPRGELAQLDAAGQRRAKIAYQGAEVDAMRGGEVDRGAVGLRGVIDADHLHRQLVLAYQALCGDPGRRLALADQRVAVEVGLAAMPTRTATR